MIAQLARVDLLVIKSPCVNAKDEDGETPQT